MSELKASISIDMSRISQGLAQADAKAETADKKTRAVQERVERALQRIKLAQQEQAKIEAAMARSGLKLGKQLGRSIGTIGIGAAVSELGIPEAAQPLVRIGTAALAGGQIGGLAGAVGGVTVGMFNELLQAVRKLDVEREAARARLIDLERQQRLLDKELEKRLARIEREIKKEIEQEREQLEDRFKDFRRRADLNSVRISS